MNYGYDLNAPGKKIQGAELFDRLGAPRTAEFFRRGDSVQIFQSALEEIGAVRFIRAFIVEGDFDSALYIFDNCKIWDKESETALYTELADLVIENGDNYQATRFFFKVSGGRRDKLFPLVLSDQNRGSGFFKSMIENPDQLSYEQFSQLMENELMRVVQRTEVGMYWGGWDDVEYYVFHPDIPEYFRKQLLEFVWQSNQNGALEFAKKLLTAPLRVLHHGYDGKRKARCLSLHERQELLNYVKRHDKKHNRIGLLLFGYNLSFAERLKVVFG